MASDPKPPREGLLQIGRVARAHGLRGEVIVEITSDRPERTEPGVSFITDVSELTVVESRRHQQKWLFRFEGCERREDADALRGVALWAEPIDDDSALWVHELIGSTVVDAQGEERGEVVSIVANPAADLLELADGTLIPVTFVVQGPTDGLVRVDTPDGLFDL